jgi:hypothetical protein
VSDSSLAVVEGDRTGQTVDAVVDAANDRLAAGGRVGGAIFAGAGRSLVGA